MRRLTYLNAILTVNAGLLCGILWTQVVSTPLLVQSAEAQVSRAADLPGIPNAAGQREQMIRQLERVNRNIEAMTKIVESGKTRVEVTNLSDIKLEKPAKSE